MKREENKFFSNTQWYHATPYWNAEKLLGGVKVDVNKGMSLDFGYGFYLCPDRSWTMNYIRNMTQDLIGSYDSNNGIIVQYEFSPIDYINNGASYKFFKKQDIEYAEFVINNRVFFDTYDFNYDFVAGLMLTEKQILSVKRYFDKQISKEDAIRDILTQTSEDWQMLLHAQTICNELKPYKIYNLEGDELNVGIRNK